MPSKLTGTTRTETPPPVDLSRRAFTKTFHSIATMRLRTMTSTRTIRSLALQARASKLRWHLGLHASRGPKTAFARVLDIAHLRGRVTEVGDVSQTL
jgi:hypothetical protein